MANRYWVGGTSNWNDANNWAATDGGAGGAGVPTSSDNVFIDSNDDITVDVANVYAANFEIGAFAVLILNGNTLNIHGTSVDGDGFTQMTGNGTIVLHNNQSWGTYASGTFNTYPWDVNINLNGYTLTKSNGGLVLANTARLDLSNSTLAGAIDTVSAGFMKFSNTTISPTLSSDFYITAQGNWAPSSSEPALSFDYTTTTINSGYFDLTIYITTPGSGVTKVVASTSPTTSAGVPNSGYVMRVPSGGSSGGTMRFTGLHNQIQLPSTAVNYEFSSCEVAGSFLSSSSGPTITGQSITLKTLSGQSNLSKTIYGVLPGLSFNNLSGSPVTYTSTGAAVGGPNVQGDVNFTTANQDILKLTYYLTCNTFNNSGTNVRALEFPGSSSGIICKNYTSATATNLTITGDSNNQRILIKTPATLTTNTFNSGSVTTYSVSLTPDGSGGTATFTGNAYDFSTYNLSYTVNATLNIYRNLTLSNSTTILGGSFTFVATSGTQTFNPNNAIVGQNITINAPGATVQLTNPLVMGLAQTLTLTAGTLDFNDQTASLGTFSSSNSNSRVIDFGSSVVTITGSGTAWDCGTSTNLSVTTGTGTISLTGGIAKTFAGGGKSWPTVNQGGTGTLSVTGNNTFANFTNTVNGCTIAFPAGTTTFSAFNVRGALGSLVTLSSTSTLSKSSGTVAVNYLDLSNSTATGGAYWYAGSGSVDGGGNSGWLFSSASTGGFLAFF